MVVQVGSARCSTVAIPTRECLLKPMEGPVQAIALMNTNPMLFGTFRLETVFKAADCIVSLLRTKELIDAALELLVLAYVASQNLVGVGEYLFNTRETFAHLLLQAADVRFATHIDASLSSNLKDGARSNDEMDRSCDHCKASIYDILHHGPVQRPDCLWEGGISEWIISAARGKDEVNSNHSKTDKAFVSGKKDNNIQDDDDDDNDDDDVEDEGESGDEENDDGEEGEEDGNEDDDDDDDDDDDEEEEEDEDEDDEEVAPISAHGNIPVQNDEEEDDDSDEGEDEEEGVEDEDDFGEDGEDEDGEEDEEDEDDEDDEDVPEPPRKKNKSS
ncbi:hypothetical protein O6H91_19G050300 [Diphasiastrum complanatum]|uniref:Uncharacterized protein n=1 Tax=Diphasiastrum complanatum TaxID=34168 RepID=A0ACC2AWF8_DIPCM|nr:hypothetical protein O6H91_19G050300 [Diphasiastrum complanatum]